MDIFAFSRIINLFLLISTNEKTLANVKGVLGAQVFVELERKTDESTGKKLSGFKL